MSTKGNVITATIPVTTIAMGGEDKLLSPKRKRTGRPTSLKKTNIASNMAQMTESLEDDMSPSTSPGTSNPIGSPIKSRRYKAPIDKQQLQGQLQNGIILKTFQTATDSLNSISNCTSIATTREGATTPPQSPSLFSTSFATRSQVSNSTTSGGHDDGENNSSSSSLFSPESFVRGAGSSGGMMQDTDHMRQGSDSHIQIASSSSSSSSSSSGGRSLSGSSRGMSCVDDRLHDEGMGGVIMRGGDEDDGLLRRPSSDSGCSNVLGDMLSADGRDEGITIMKSDYSPFRRPTSSSSSSSSSSALANARADMNGSSSSLMWQQQQRISGEGGVDVRGGGVPSSSSGSMYSKRMPSFTCPGSENLRPPLRNSEDEWRSQGSSFEEEEGGEGESDDEKSSIGSPGARRSRRLKFSPGGLLLPSREGDDDEAESQHDNSDFAGRLSALHVGKTKSRTLFSDVHPGGSVSGFGSGPEGLDQSGSNRHHHSHSHSHGSSSSSGSGGIADGGMIGGSRLQDDLNGSEYSVEHGGGNYHHTHQQQHHHHDDVDHIRNRPPHLFARTGQRSHHNGNGGNIDASYQNTLSTHPTHPPYQHTLSTHHIHPSYQHTLSTQPSLYFFYYSTSFPSHTMHKISI